MDVVNKMQIFIYLGLHALFGLIAGILFHFVRDERVSRRRRWFAYLVGIAICLAVVAAIGEVSNRWDIKELYRWIGAVIVLLSFLVLVVPAGKATRRK